MSEIGGSERLVFRRRARQFEFFSSLRQKLLRLLISTAAFVILIFGVESRSGAQLTILHSFGDGTVSNDGAYPAAALIQAPDGNFYGTTNAEATGKIYGTFFQITPAGVLKIIFRFDGKQASDQSLLYYKGSLIGVSAGRAKHLAGAVFALTESPKGHWTHQVWHTFTETGGNGPGAPLIEGSDGNLYGTTQFGGSAGLGTIYRLDPRAKTVIFLYSFTQLVNCFPQNALLQTNNGNFYGVTTDSLNGCAIFEMTPDADVTIFYTFASSYFPAGPLIQGSDGNFYVGVDYLGTANGATMLQITPSGVATILHTFGQGTDGSGVLGAVVQGPNGRLYGMTAGGGTAGKGTIFEMSTDGSSYTVLHSFGDGSVPHDGNSPAGALVLGADNNLYGVTTDGGSARLGTVFKISP